MNRLFRAEEVLSFCILLFSAILGIIMASCVHSSPSRTTSQKHIPVSVPGFAYVRSLGGVDEYLFKKNGLRVLLKRDTFVPVATVMVTYEVGSVHEKSGETGVAHMLEHMMFKESANFRRKDRRDINELLDKKGARLNASTWLDRTNYFETIGVPFLEDAIALEADRMRNAIFDPKELVAEMTVVRNEYEIVRNSPERVLLTELYATAFQTHPYHHPTIGWLSDIKAYTVSKLQSFYDTYYRPDNAVVSVVGDIDPVAVLRLIKKHFGVYAKSATPVPSVTDEESEQTGERRVTVKRPGTYDLLGMFWKKPPAIHADMPALTVLATVLGGGETSMLTRALVDTGVASDIEVEAYPHHYASGFEIFVRLTPGTRSADVETAIKDIVARIKDGHVSEEDVARARRMLAVAYAAQEGSTASFSDMLCEAVAAGDWTLAFTMPKKIAKVSREDVIRVARMYLNDDTSIIGVYEGQA